MEIRYKVMANKFDFRLEMVRAAQEYGISEAARLFEVSRPTVYKWKGRFEVEGLDGLKDRSRRPHRSPNRINEGIRREIIRLKKRMLHCGADRLRNEFGVKASTKTIQKVFGRRVLSDPGGVNGANSVTYGKGKNRTLSL